MPKGPQGQKRPADVIGAAIKIAKIATGEEDEDKEPEKGKRGGEARAKKLSDQRRAEIAQKASQARWGTSSKCPD
jgi:hypothetical protein